jgi:hypothetical protein
MISIGIVSEYRSSFDTPHHNVMQGIGSVDSGSLWHETPLPFPTLASQLNNLTASPSYYGQTMWGVIQAYTGSARSPELSVESAYRLERAGGQILALVN